MAELDGASTALRHMETYARFVGMSDSEINEALSPLVQPDTPLLEPHRVRKVSALSDFAPVNLKVRKYVIRLDLEPEVDYCIVFKEETWRADRRTKAGAAVSSCSMAFAGERLRHLGYVCPRLHASWLQVSNLRVYPRPIWVLHFHSADCQCQGMAIRLLDIFRHHSPITGSKIFM